MDSVLIVAHGSSEDLNGDAAPMFAERLTASLGRKVHYAYKGDIEPTVESALKEISEEDPDRIVVLPLFFAPGICADCVAKVLVGIPVGVVTSIIGGPIFIILLIKWAKKVWF